MNKKHIISILLCAVLVLPILQGCNAGNTPVETSATESSVVETSAPETTTEAVSTTAEVIEEPDYLENYPNLFVTYGTETLNVRKTPSMDGEIIATLGKYAGGNVVEDQNVPENWAHITSGDVEGYVSKDFIKTGAKAEKIALKKVQEKVKVTKADTKIYKKADQKSEVLAKTEKGAFYKNLGKKGNFYKVKYQGKKKGFIPAKAVETGYYLKEAVKVQQAVTTSASESTTATSSENESSTSESTGESTTEAETAASRPATGKTVCIDAGHQAYGIAEMEPNGPGSGVMKAKLTTGTQGCATGIPEYEINLQVSLKLQAELARRGYNVVMIRTDNNCPLSNAERAQVANNSGAGAFVRIHCNSSDNSGVTGVINYAPSAGNPYMNPGVVSESNRLASLLAGGICQVTGAANRGVLQDDTMTGINWCQIPVSIVEMGFMSNPTEDQLLADPGYQQKIVTGMANALDAFFGQ